MFIYMPICSIMSDVLRQTYYGRYDIIGVVVVPPPRALVGSPWGPCGPLWAHGLPGAPPGCPRRPQELWQ